MELPKAIRLSWRRFVSTDAGKEGLLALRENSPSITRGDQHQMIFDAGRVEGYKQALDAIYSILAVREEKEENLENE